MSPSQYLNRYWDFVHWYGVDHPMTDLAWTDYQMALRKEDR